MKYVNFTLNEVDLEFKGVFTCKLEDTENETSGKEVDGVSAMRIISFESLGIKYVMKVPWQPKRSMKPML